MMTNREKLAMAVGLLAGVRVMLETKRQADQALELIAEVLASDEPPV